VSPDGPAHDQFLLDEIQLDSDASSVSAFLPARLPSNIDFMISSNNDACSKGAIVSHTLKTVMLSGALALCAMLFGCGNLSPSGDPEAVGATSSAAIVNVCDAFCQGQGGSLYHLIFATSETACTQKAGDWYTSDQGYTGPPPGCCCKCALQREACL
jgi:hypothetical protein